MLCSTLRKWSGLLAAICLIDPVTAWQLSIELIAAKLTPTSVNLSQNSYCALEFHLKLLSDSFF